MRGHTRLRDDTEGWTRNLKLGRVRLPRSHPDRIMDEVKSQR